MQGERVVVWDLPTRIFHWLLATAFLVEWLTQDDARYLDFHVFCGYLIGGLIAFRVIWGFTGTRWARFASFAFGPFAALRYLRDLLHRRQAHFVGHNPAGSWSIFILLTLGALSVLSGVAALGGEKQQGPFQGLLTFAQGDALREMHEVLAWTMLVVVAMHILGVVASSLSDRENLPAAMIRGRKRAASEQSVSLAANAAIAMLVVLAGFAAWYFRGYFKAPRDVPYLPFTGTVLAMDAQWQHECGSCHLAYHPSLLPARSWQALFARQQDHFGEDLALDAQTVASLSSFAGAHSAENAETPAAWKIASRTPAASTPLQITETPYWKSRHAEVADADWQRVKKIDCGGCHLDAEQGTFEPGAIHIGKSGVTPERRHMRRTYIIGSEMLLCALLAMAGAPNAAADPVDDLLKEFTAQGASNFSVQAGERFWDHPVTDPKSGEVRRCSLCHSNDLRRTGKHATTGKLIEPLAPSVNPKRLTDKADIQKWLLRNCKWTLGRECTPQEKGDVLVMIRSR